MVSNTNTTTTTTTTTTQQHARHISDEGECTRRLWALAAVVNGAAAFPSCSTDPVELTAEPLRKSQTVLERVCGMLWRVCIVVVYVVGRVSRVGGRGKRCEGTP
jgi:hypothetical protein